MANHNRRKNDPIGILDPKINLHTQCPLTPNAVAELLSQLGGQKQSLLTIEAALITLSTRSIEDHVEIARRETLINQIPDIINKIDKLDAKFEQKYDVLDASHNRGKGAIWVIVTMVGAISIIATDFLSYIKDKFTF